MRWKKGIKFRPKIGTKRIVSKFLLFPLCLNGEYRWFERVYIEQEYEKYYDSSLIGYRHCWSNRNWAKGEE